MKVTISDGRLYELYAGSTGLHGIEVRRFRGKRWRRFLSSQKKPDSVKNRVFRFYLVEPGGFEPASNP